MKKLLFIIGLSIPMSSMARVDSTFFNGSVALHGNYVFGNYNNYTIGGAIYGKYVIKNSSFELTTSYRYTENGFIKDVSNPSKDSFALKEKEFYNVISYSYSLKNLRFISFSEQEKSFLRKINLRYDVGVGFGYKFFNSKKIFLEISEAILPEINSYIIKEYDVTSLRASTRIKFVYDNDFIRFSDIILYQPSIWCTNNVPNASNLNIRNSTTFDVSIYKNLSIGLSNEYVLQKYVHYIFPTKRVFDNSLTFYIKYYFK
jgi:hypothetical protein